MYCQSPLPAQLSLPLSPHPKKEEERARQTERKRAWLLRSPGLAELGRGVWWLRRAIAQTDLNSMPCETSEAAWRGISHADAKRYDGYFVLLDASGNGQINRTAAEPLFERAALQPHQVAHIWALADIDGDEMLNPSEFRIAMHLAT